MRQLVRKAAALSCNAIEITSIAATRFLGLSRVSIRVHFRHLQKESALFSGELQAVTKAK
jgi:hypothetical protein